VSHYHRTRKPRVPSAARQWGRERSLVLVEEAHEEPLISKLPRRLWGQRDSWFPPLQVLSIAFSMLGSIPNQARGFQWIIIFALQLFKKIASHSKLLECLG
jgi:hypothetical protein